MPTFALLMYSFAAFTSLAYEILWIKTLSLNMGMSLVAVGTVLAVFLAGVGCGGIAAARAYPTRLSTLELFGVLQIVLGIYAWFLPLLFQKADLLYTAWAPAIDSMSHIVLRSLIAAILLLFPCTLMGAIFPLLSRLTKTAERETTSGLGLLYFTGVAGSAIGAWVTGFSLLPRWGVTGSMHLLALLNILTGVSSLAFWRRSFAGEPGYFAKPAIPSKRAPNSSLLVPAGVIGVALFSAEIVWIKLIWLVVDATVYAEAAVIGTVLVAMAAGSGLYLVLRRLRINISTIFLSGLFACAVFQLLLLLNMAEVAPFFDRFVHNGTWVGASWTRYVAAHFVLALLVGGLPSIGYGLLFPCLCDLAAQTKPTLSSQIGHLYAWHNWGSVAGSALAAFLIVPLFGLSWTLVAVSWLLLSMAYWHASRSLSQRTKILSCGAALALALAAIPAASRDITYREYAAGKGEKVIFHREDGSNVVEVYEDRGTGYRSLRSSRLRQEGGNSSEEVYVARVQGYLPLLLHPQPSRVLVIGLGTGISVAPFFAPEVRQVTAVEISKGIIEASKLFSKDNKNLADSSKLQIIHQDGRNFIKLTRERYDLIVQELFFPYQSGVGSLYTLEHYQACRTRLTDGGLMAQWIAINQVAPEDLRTLVATFRHVFPSVSLWLNGGYLLIMGSDSPFDIDLSSFRQRFGREEVIQDLGLLGSPDPYDFLSTFVSSGRAIQGWIRGATINTDDNLRIEHHTPLYFHRLNSVELAVENVERLIEIKTSLANVVRETASAEAKRLAEVDRAHLYLLKGIARRALGDLNTARDFYQRGFSLNRANHQLKTFIKKDFFEQGHQALIAGDFHEAARLLDQALAIDPQFLDALFDRALVYARNGQSEEATTLYQEILDRNPVSSPARFNLGVSLYRLGRYQKAADAFRKVTEQEPASVDAYFNLANSLVKLGRHSEALRRYRQTLLLKPDHHFARENLEAVFAWLRTSQTRAEVTNQFVK